MERLRCDRIHVSRSTATAASSSPSGSPLLLARLDYPGRGASWRGLSSPAHPSLISHLAQPGATSYPDSAADKPPCLWNRERCSPYDSAQDYRAGITLDHSYSRPRDCIDFPSLLSPARQTPCAYPYPYVPAQPAYSLRFYKPRCRCTHAHPALTSPKPIACP